MVKKYRPYITQAELQQLIDILAIHKAESKQLAALYVKFVKLDLDIYAGIKQSASASTDSSSPAERRKAAFLKQQQGFLLTEEETELAETYKWEHEL